MRSSHRICRAAGLLATGIALAATPAGAHWAPRATPHGRWWNVRATFGASPVLLVRGRPPALVDFNVEPKSTRIWVDGTFRGICDEFDGHPQKMSLAPGRHHIRLVLPDGRELVRTVELSPGYELNLDAP